MACTIKGAGSAQDAPLMLPDTLQNAAPQAERGCARRKPWAWQWAMPNAARILCPSAPCLIWPEHAVYLQPSCTQRVDWAGKAVPTTYGRPGLSALGSSTVTFTEWYASAFVVEKSIRALAQPGVGRSKGSARDATWWRAHRSLVGPQSHLAANIDEIPP